MAFCGASAVVWPSEATRAQTANRPPPGPLLRQSRRCSWPEPVSRGRLLLVRAAKGFGSSTPASPKSGKAKSRKKTRADTSSKRGFGGLSESRAKEVQYIRGEEDDAVKLAMQDLKGIKNERIDVEEAAKGSVEFVQVENWGGGQTEDDLKNLKVRSHATTNAYVSLDKPLYEQMVYRLQLLESKGELSIAGKKDVPPFHEWQFGLHHYHQYLLDQLAVHSAIEQALDTAAKKHLQFESKAGACSRDLLDSFGALKCFTDLRMSRVGALKHDIKAVEGLWKSHKDEKAGNARLRELSNKPTAHARAYAKDIERIEAKLDQEADTAGFACRQLIANTYATYIAQLTTGMRIGSSGVERLGTGHAGAVRYYTVYPKLLNDPLKAFIKAVNTAGLRINSIPLLEEVMGELPRAMQKTSLMYGSLAVRETTSPLPM